MKYRNAALGAAFATAALLLSGTAATAQVTITESPVAPPPVDPGTGLTGNYYGEPGNTDNAVVQDNTDAAAYIAGNTPVATFLSTEVDYPGPPQNSADDNSTTLDQFLGTDSATLTNNAVVGSNTLSGQIIQFTGFLDITTPGGYDFSLASDDGSYLDFGSQLAIDNGNDHAMQQATQELIFTTPGLYSMALTYYENGGGTGIYFIGSDGTSLVPTSQLYPSLASPEPGSVPLLLGTLSMMGLVRLRRRRSAV